MSKIYVDEIRHSGGAVAAINIDSSGRVTMANTVEIDIWRLATSQSTNADLVGWERSDNATSGYAGTGMTESSGVFTFPSTGLWKVSGCFLVVAAAGDTSAGLVTQVSTDSGSSFTTTGGAFDSAGSTTNAANTSTAFQTIINVTNASTFRFKLVTSGLNSGSNISGNTSRDYSTLIFERITDAQ